jgi:hypothetical protein
MNEANEQATKGLWDDAEVIYAYTRAQALEDGVLVDVSEPGASSRRSGADLSAAQPCR